ncbi:MAG: membrane-bound lytic murein transglycosylase F [Planctomycetota bacterium]|jgi:membrane-bound lytic murein transglycosylase F
MLHKTILFITTISFVAACLFLSGCSNPPSKLQQVLQRGEIRIVTHNGPSTYYVDKDGETGLEYELATRFAIHLGVKLSLIVARNGAEVNELIRSGQADIAAGGINRPFSPDALLIYGPGYHWVTRQIVYRKSHWRPTSLDDIYPDQLDIADGTVPVSTLEKLQKKSPSLSWLIHDDKENSDLLAMIENGEIVYTVAYSNDIILARASYPEIRPAFNITGPVPLAWAVKNSADFSLLSEIEKFHNEIADNGQLADLVERFYGPTGFFDYVDSRKFIDKYRSSLPGLKQYFKHSAEKHNIDWRLLAALSYQESHWNKNARSYTGVRGLMMLTKATAKQVGVDNRLDPKQSIEGGAKYLSSLIERVPERIKEPDRSWFALAAYNVGFGHLEDARVLTQKDGGDADLWQEVKLRLPLLSKRVWYKQTKHGYARGNEPVKFVEKIRKYYNVLVQLTQENRTPAPQLADTIIIDSPLL